MAKFDFKKAILENKATFYGSLNEGQFSWFTQDTDQQIGSEPENTLPFVYMHDNKGNKWLEKNYDGYGEFGGKDYYELLDQMNGGNGDRSRGIDLAFDKEAVAAGKILFPALTVSATLPSYHSFNEEPKNDPNQSWYTPEEDDFYDQNDEEEYGYNDDEEEELDEAQLPALELDQVQNIAQQVANEFTKYETELDLKFSITPDSVEASPKGAGFDLDITAGPNTPGDEWKDERGFGIENYLGKFAGGSYIIKSESDKHKIYNAATGNSYIGYVTPEGEVVFEYEKSMNEAEEAPKSNKMKKSELKELIKSSIMKEMYLDVDNMEDAPESEVDFLAEVDAILAEADKVKEGVWSVMPERIPEFIQKIKDIMEEYHAVVGSDDVYNGLDQAISAAKELMTLREADEEVAVDDTESSVDGEENIDVNTTVEVDPNVKAVQDSLTQAQAAAQKLGDPKLTDQIGNTITFFTRAHVVDKGAVAEELNEAKSLLFSFDYNTDEDNVDYIQGLLKDARVDAIAQPGLESEEMIVKAKNEVELRKAKKVIQANGFKIYESVEEDKKEYYKDAESDDAAHINALEKDMKDDKESSMKIKEVIFPMWIKLNK
jgi:hypothetical protein